MKKRILSLVIVFALITSSLTFTAAAKEERENQIDSLFGELNQIAQQQVLEQSKENSTANTASKTKSKLEYAQRKSEIYAQLEDYGVKLVDPKDTETVSRLNQIVTEAESNKVFSNTTLSSRSVNPPDFSDLAEMYDIAEQTTVFTINGQTYQTVCLTVTHNGTDGSKLFDTETQLINMQANPAGMVAEAFMSYVFEIGTDEFMGIFPWYIEYTLGAYLDLVLGQDYNGTAIVSTDNESYLMRFTSTTQMRYYYVYLPGLMSWVQCGSTVSNFNLARADVISFAIGNLPVNETINLPSENIPLTINKTWLNFVSTYVNTGVDQDIGIGSLTMKGQRGISTIYEPAMFSMISLLF